jgi:hypothetical protein
VKALATIAAIVAVAAVPTQAGAQSQAEPAVVWAVGDGANGTAAAARLARRIAAARPDRFLYLGDVYDHGTATEFRRNYSPVYGRLAPITEPTPGNHEWANRASGYYPYWRKAKGRRQPPWYSFRVAGWEVLSLNSEASHGPRSAQLRWLRRQLTEPGTCRLAFWHRPRYSAGTVHGDAPDMAPVWRALVGKARLVVSAHDHNLQRLRARRGLTQLVAGAGGPYRHRLRRDRRLAFARSDVTGALRLVLEPGRARIQFRSTGGAVLDSSRASCRPLGQAR